MTQPPGSSWGAPPPPPPPPPPPMPVPPYSVVAPGVGAFRSLRGLAISLYVLLSVVGLLALVAIPVAINARSVVREHTAGGIVSVDHSVKTATDAVSGVIGFEFLVGLAIAVVFMIWMYRAASNLPLFARVQPKFGPGFAIGGWFIPLANLIIPGMQMFDIDRGSGPKLRGGERATGSGLVVLWWITFIVGRFTGSLSSSFREFNQYRAGTFSVTNLLVIVGSALTAIAAVLAIVVVRRITGQQEIGAAELAAGGSPGFAPAIPGYPSPFPPAQPYYEPPQTWTPPSPPAAPSVPPWGAPEQDPSTDAPGWAAPPPPPPPP